MITILHLFSFYLYMNKQNTSENTLSNNTSSLALNLENLSAKYDKLLNEYNQIQADYINYLNGINNDNKDPEVLYKTIQGKAFWGTGKLNTNASSVKDINECKALCSKDTKCSGATYNAITYGKPTCWLRTGDGDVIDATKDDTAIVSKKMLFLNRMKTINSQLQTTNAKIMALVSNQGDSIYKDQIKTRQEKAKVLEQNNAILHKQEAKLLHEINQYESIQQEQNEESIKVTQNYALYGVLFVIVIIASVLFYKMSTANMSSPLIQTGGSFSNMPYYWAFIMIFVAVIIQLIYGQII